MLPRAAQGSGAAREAAEGHGPAPRWTDQHSKFDSTNAGLDSPRRYTFKMTLIILLISAIAGFAQEMVPIPAGTIAMKDFVTTLPLTVRVSGFLIGKTEVTQREYERVLATNPSVYKGADRPVENVSWWDALRYCNLRSVEEGLPACYDLATGRREPGCTGYRLPTEAEWTRAAGTVPQPEQLAEVANLGSRSTKSMAVFQEPLKTGTAAAAARKANEFGLHDVFGNVWEWCGDFYEAEPSPASVRDPAGPVEGLERVIRGGSFVSTTSGWSRGYRSSRYPDSRSRFTGFRVARSVPASGGSDPQTPETFLARFNQPPAGFESSIGALTPLTEPVGTLTARLKAKWEGLLGEPKVARGAVIARTLRDVPQRHFSGQLMEIEMEPGVWEKIYVVRPSDGGRRAAPVMIVPYYDVDTPAGLDLAGRRYSGAGVRAFAYMAAQHGYVAVAVRWFGESYGESYSEAVANVALRHPGSTGMGKWVSDARRVVDFIETLPGVDASRIGIIGHSLGGKMALYAAAMEPRIRAVVSSEPGIGFSFTNYEDYWYLGDRIASAPPGTDQHELLALIAPRPFLLIGGESSDKDESWHYINAAGAVYEQHGQPRNIGYINHRAGHTPTAESIVAAFEWLDYFINRER